MSTESKKEWQVLRVDGARLFNGRMEQFTAGVIFERTGKEEWKVISCAPFLSYIFNNLPVAKLKERLTKEKFKWEWV